MKQKKVQYGVPQGTVLGPILFNIYLNNLFYQESTGKIVTFADDTAILYSDNSWESLYQKAELDFKNLKKWFDLRLLTINFEKTKYMTFSINKMNNLPNLNLQDTGTSKRLIIEHATNVKYLGIHIDCHLKWNIHIKKLITKLRSMLSKFKNFSKFLGIKELKIMYYAFVESHLTYGIIAWGGAYQNQIIPLEIIQKWILKIMFKKDITYPTDDLFQMAKVADIRQLFCIAILIEQKKSKNKKEIKHKYETRYKQGSFVTPTTQKTLCQRCFTYLGPRTYNELPLEIKKINSVGLFRKKVKNYIQNLPRMEIYKLIDLKNFLPQ